MARLDDVLKAMILFHGRRIAREVVGNLPAAMKQANRDIRATQKTLEKLTRQVERLAEQHEPEPSIPAPSEDQLKTARLTKRTLPALRKRFGLTQQELAKLLQVADTTIGSWELGKKRPRERNMVRIIALRSITQAQVDAALGRGGASEEEVEKARFVKRTLPALRKGFRLTQAELATLLQVTATTVGLWEREKVRPNSESVAKLTALRSMSPEQVDAALGRVAASAAVTPQQIKGLRQKLALTQGEFAGLLGVSASAVTLWEQGKSAPGAGNRAALAQIKAMTQEELNEQLGRTGTPTARTAPGAQTALSPEEFRRIREEAGLSQRELSKKLGMSVNTVSSWERGSTRPQAKSLEKLLAMRK